jgi:hypothetical protein
MRLSVYNTLLTLVVVGPIIGVLIVFIVLFLTSGSFAGTMEEIRLFKLEGFRDVLIVSELLSLVSAGSFIGIGIANGRLPIWSAIVPGSLGVTCAIAFYAARGFRSLGGAHGPMDLLVIGPATLIFIIGLVSYFVVRQFWTQERV